MGDDYTDLLVQLWFTGAGAAVCLLLVGARRCRARFGGKR